VYKRFISSPTRLLQKTLVALIRGYQFWLRPFMGNRCRFYPSCSQYAKTAIQELGTMRGLFLMVKRLLRCHPFHPGGFDPVPGKQRSEKRH